MIKKIAVIVVVAVGLATYTYGQGTVIFNTKAVGPGGANSSAAQVYDVTVGGTSNVLGAPIFGPGFVGTNWFAQLYAAASSTAALTPVSGLVNFGSGTQAGWVTTGGNNSLGQPINSVVTVVPTGGAPAWVQVRAWWGGGNVITNYDDAVNSLNANSRYGSSPVLALAATGDPNATPTPSPPVNLIGLQGFQLIPVPEPATLALAGMGAAALLLFRRRK